MSLALDRQVTRPATVRWAAPVVAAVLVAVVAVRVAASASTVGFGQLVAVVVVAAWALAGAVVVRQPKLRALGLLAFWAAAVGGVTAVADSAGAEVLRSVGIGVLVTGVALHLLLALPDGRLGTTARKVTTTVGYSAGVLLGAALGDELVWWPVWVAAFMVAAVGVPASHQRYVKASPRDRQRLQLMGCAAAVVVEVALAGLAIRVLLGWPTNACAALAALTVIIPLSMAAGASPWFTMRADRLLVSTVSFIGLTALITAIYLLVVVGLGRPPTHAERSILLLSMSAAGLAAVAYSPARRRLAAFAGNLVYGEREAPDTVIRSFGSRLSRAVPLDELLLQLAESLKRAMQLSSVEVWTGADGRLDRTITLPDRGAATISLKPTEQRVVAEAGAVGRAWVEVWLPALLDDNHGTALRVTPVANSGQLLGLLVVERVDEADPFTEGDERLLTDLARQVGLALHNLQLDTALQASIDEVRRQADELRASRTRIVAAADAERRKIERNLHDGAQQHLVALAVNIRLLKGSVEKDPAAAVAMLDQLADDVRVTLQELRDLAHGIYPPLLIDSGLAAALRTAAGRSPLAVDVEAVGDRFPSEVEAAIYFCCLEALQNAAKHVPDAGVTVTVAVEDGALVFEVADDGPGFDTSGKGRAGHGFVNMGDRLGAIGGTLLVESSPGAGTKVGGRVPLDAMDGL